MTARTPTPQAISALLRKAGFERSRPVGRGRVKWSGETVRGSRQRAPGFEAKAENGTVIVRFRSGPVFSPDATAELRIRMLRRYGEEIDAAGYGALIRFDGAASGVIVTAPVAASDTGLPPHTHATDYDADTCPVCFPAGHPSESE